MVYVCDVCGYIYDESTKTKSFDDLADSWHCPVCGADKESFSPREKEGIIMKVILNPDREIVNSVNKALLMNGGYCPCKTARNDDTKCMCKEFLEEIRSPDFSGPCSCGLYCKV